MSKEIIHFDSPEAAQLVTVTGWRSRNGQFYGEGDGAENAARYDGCTHRACDHCGKPARKTYTVCDDCRELRAIEKYAARPRADWNGSDPLYSEGAERWFSDMDELRDYCEDNEATPSALRLVICEPVLAGAIDPNEHYSDELPEDGGNLPAEIEEAFAHLNRVINACKTPLSWVPGQFAASLESTDIGAPE